MWKVTSMIKPWSNTFFPGKDRFQNLKASYLASGLTTRTHGNARRLPKHVLKLEEVKNLVTFISNYAEKHAILLPGRIPGYKRDDIQLLPSSTTKKVTIRVIMLHDIHMYVHVCTEYLYHNTVVKCMCTTCSMCITTCSMRISIITL